MKFDSLFNFPLRSEREDYIRLKYVSRAFVHNHPDFERPEVPVPPPRIQGTLLRAAATSPKLAGKLNRPVSMATGLDLRPSPVASPLPPTQTKSPTPAMSSDSPLGGLNLRPESMALLEENWRKLEKNGRLQQWNLKNMVNVVKSPRKAFSLHKFARPGSFRKKKSPLVGDDYSHSDNELEESISSLLLSAGSAGQSMQCLSPSSIDPPRKPPRTYTTTSAHIDSTADSRSLFNPEGDDFSSDLLSTLDRLGSVYSISALCGEETDGANEEEPQPNNTHKKIMRSVSAVETPKSNQLREERKEDWKIPTINIELNKGLLTEEEEEIGHGEGETGNLGLMREISRSLGSVKPDETAVQDLIDSVSGTPTKHQAALPGSGDTQNATPTHQITLLDPDDNQSVDSLDVDIDCDKFNPKKLDYVNYEDDDSSVDSYMSAIERSELLASHSSSSPPPTDIIRPDSEASELFHTPPNSISSSPTGLESIDPSMVTNLGLALGVNVTLEDLQVKKMENRTSRNFSDLAVLNELDETVKETHNINSLTDGPASNHSSKESPSHVTWSPGHVKDGDIPVNEEMSNQVTQTTDHETKEGKPIAEKGEDESGGVDNGEEQRELLDQLSEYDIHIIPDDIHPSKVSLL